MSEILTSIPVSIVATGALVGVAASLLGTFLVLRGTSMLADAISHSIILGIVLVWMATGQTSGPVQIVGAALTGLLTVVATEALARTRKMSDDAAIGLVFPALFSVGVLLLNVYARDVHIDAHTVLLGEIGFVWLDVVTVAGVQVPDALLWMAVVALVNLAFVTAFYKELEIATFDPGLAAALGFAPAALGYALLGLTSATAVAAFDAVGVVLFLAFVIVPPAAAWLLTDVLWRVLAYAAAMAAASAGIGYALAVAWDVSIGGMMAVVTGAFLAAAFLLGPRHGLLAQEARRRGQVAANAARALTVHLYRHEGGPDAEEETAVRALRTHLAWSDAKARAVVARCLDTGWVERHGDRLVLTERGRAAAREIVAPGRGPATAPSPAR
jgi:manganese/zinc/iron transport system permease protein